MQAPTRAVSMALRHVAQPQVWGQVLDNLFTASLACSNAGQYFRRHCP